MSGEVRTESDDETATTDAFLESEGSDSNEVVEQVIVDSENSSSASEQPQLRYMMSLILNFLDVPGHVLLIEGAPGTGKTSLALEILNQMENTHKVYASSRVSPAKLRQDIPWIDEVIDSMSGRSARASWVDELEDIRSSEPDNILNKVLRLKHSKRKAVLVLDSWEGAVRNAKEEGRSMLESSLLSELDESGVSVVIVMETEKHDHLGYLVDGIASLSQSEVEGRRTRLLELKKLRGFEVSALRGFFTLDKGRFTLLPQGPDDNYSHTQEPLTPIPHNEKYYSTGVQDLDLILGGGVERSTLLLIDVDSNVPPRWMKLLLNIMRANFVNQGGTCFILPTGGYSSDNIAKSLRPFVSEEAMKERVRIAAYNRNSSPKEWKVPLSGQLQEDVRTFARTWAPLSKNKAGTIVSLDLDRLATVYGDDYALPGFTEIGEELRDAEALQICTSSIPTKVRQDTLRNADYHLKVQNEGGSFLVYGIKPFTQEYAVRAEFDKGYPAITLIPIV
ncbi:MAG TPA: gas vesicle protein GvpD P-loop domain-containing protein [Candidatus Dormibacteraeota bacterium]|nr:gas vesicle protein GvpD P-loop domain-containing protein [Candidatus Dormibacteraeota bacterium]